MMHEAQTFSPIEPTNMNTSLHANSVKLAT